jgi:hypothetical protein
MPEAARPAASSRMTVRLASALAAKIRRGERTATSRCRHVPSRSSAANTSPATSDVSSGNTQLQENDRITSGPAHPVWPIQRPKTVSDGSELCRLTTTTNNAGPRQQATSIRRIGHWASSLTSSKR